MVGDLGGVERPFFAVSLSTPGWWGTWVELRGLLKPEKVPKATLSP